MSILGKAVWNGNGQMSDQNGLKFFNLDKLAQGFKGKYFLKSGYILHNFVCILVLLPGTSL
jgi:hypothetical protein